MFLPNQPQPDHTHTRQCQHRHKNPAVSKKQAGQVCDVEENAKATGDDKGASIKHYACGQQQHTDDAGKQLADHAIKHEDRQASPKTEDTDIIKPEGIIFAAARGKIDPNRENGHHSAEPECHGKEWTRYDTDSDRP